ncbi:spore coat U domain-containing protein [Candidatus Deferrimicrobium sp.]|uniref:Csu type fimbrial protein n=1 Tax=Candidatus Deferrimicrobium sp. TaxID=3060586 RepID=UPI002ED81106
MKNSSKALAAVLFLQIGIPAHAACLVSATGMNFGAYDVFAAVPRDSAGTVTVACDPNPPTDVTVSIGSSPTSGGFNPRRMRHVTLSDRLDYNLFTTPSMVTVWGDGSAGTSTVLLRKVNRNRPVTTTIYGRIPPGQNVSVGAYSDAVTVTVTP